MSHSLCVMAQTAQLVIHNDLTLYMPVKNFFEKTLQLIAENFPKKSR